jgi:phosphopantothenoylcysteine decarboxylase/phosphopantothenate--cysteine ligase
MGFALAEAAAYRGADVTLIYGKTEAEKPMFVKAKNVFSAKDMFDEVKKEAPDCDIVIKAAAVADYRPKVISDEKIKKSDSELTLELEKTEDILKFLGEHKKQGQFLCGFAMETSNLTDNARDKLRRKNLDLICANSLRTEGAGFGGDTNIVTLITNSDETELPQMSKFDTANAILDKIIKMI